MLFRSMEHKQADEKVIAAAHFPSEAGVI